MNSHIGLGIFGTFGEPYGFQQAFYYGAQFRGSLDLDEQEIEFYPGADLYAVRREVIDGVHYICICIYSYAQELNTSRLGTFIGSCMVLQDGFTEAEYAAKVLQSLHDDLMTNEDNVLDGVIRAENAGKIIIREPAEFVAVQANVIPLNKTPFYSAQVDTAKKILIIPSATSFGNKETEVFAFLDEALKHYSDTGTLYFSFDRNVYDFVRSTHKIETMEWHEFVGRKESMLRSTAVRTKKGIQKAAPQPVEYVPIPGKRTEEAVHEEPAEATDEIVPVAAGLTNEREWQDDDILPSADPYKPFSRWQQPEVLWTENEVRERVSEYNRLFNYTNTLIDHINEENQFVVRQNRKRQLLVAALLLLLISGSVAVYFMGMYKPATETKIVAAVPETPRTIGNKQIVVNNDTFIAAPSQREANGTPPAIAELETTKEPSANDAAPTSPPPKEMVRVQRQPASPEFDLDDLDEEPSVGSRPVTSRYTMPATATTPTATPVVPATPVSATAETVTTGAMPRINLPGATHANLPAAAIYTSKVKPESTAVVAPAQPSATVAATAASAGTATTTRPGALMPALPKPVGGITSFSAAVAAPTVTAVLPAGNTAGMPAVTRTVTPAVPARAAADVAKPALATNAATRPAAVATNTTVAVPPTMLVVPPKPANISVNPLPAAVHSFAATAKTQRVTTVAIPALFAVTPPKTVAAAPLRDTAKKLTSPVKSNTTVMRQEPVRSGVSDGEINRANAMIMPQMAVAARPVSPEMKMKTLTPRPNGYITQRDVPLLYQSGIKDKTLTELTRIILDNAPELVGSYYKGQELQYAAALLNGNRQAFERRGEDYICTGDYLILHIPAVIRNRRPVAVPK